MTPSTCGRCGEEIRYGRRGTTTGWLHREEKDHQPILGRPWTMEDQAHVAAEMSRPRTRLGKDDLEETYTTNEVDILKDPDATRRALRLAEYRGEDPDHVEPLPDPEVLCHPVEVESFPPRSGIRQIVNTVLKAEGWELRRLTHARGPYVGSAGTVLSISDSVVMGARGPEVDGGTRVAVASWRDGKFDFAYTGILKDGTVTTQPADTKALKAWIKDTP